MWIFVNCLIDNPAFDSQSKDNMTLVQKKFGSTAKMSAKFMTACSKCGIADAVQGWMNYKEKEKIDNYFSGSKTAKIKGFI